MDNDHPARAMFRVSPAAYVGERTRLAKAAKAAGDKDLGKQLQALKRPTLAMWAVVAATDDPDDVHELLAVTDELAAVQGSGDRAATVEATKRRRATVEVVVGAAVEALQPWEPSAEARRAEIRTIVDQLSRHPELASAWIDGTLRELPETDAFGFAAFTGMEVPEKAASQPKAKPERRLRSVPPLPSDDGDGTTPMPTPTGVRRPSCVARTSVPNVRRARARAAATREARRNVEAATKALTAAQRKVIDAERVSREAEATLRAVEADRDIAARRHAAAASRLAEFTDNDY